VETASTEASKPNPRREETRWHGKSRARQHHFTLSKCSWIEEGPKCQATGPSSVISSCGACLEHGPALAKLALKPPLLLARGIGEGLPLARRTWSFRCRESWLTTNFEFDAEVASLWLAAPRECNNKSQLAILRSVV
jgi:hypothetical protein